MIDLDMAIKIATFLMSIAAMFIAVFRTRRAHVDERFKTGSDRMDRHEGRLARLEQTVQSLPKSADIHKLEIHMTEMAGTLQRMEAVLGGNQQIMGRLETVVTRHEEHLLKGNGK